MADETILIDVQYDTGEAEQNIDELTSSIEGQKVALSQLQEQVKSGQKTQTEASKEQEKIKTQLQAENKQRKDLIKIVQSEKGSRDQLKQTISQLIRQRNGLNMSTKQGAKEAKALSKQIETLDKKLQKTGTTTEKAKGNIGKYGQALNGLPGPIGMVINSVKMLTKVLFATPLGWIIGLLAVAGSALKTFFTGSVEGQERWNKTMNKAKSVGAVFKDELINMGKGLSDFTKNLKDSEGGVSGWAKSVSEKAKGAWKDFRKDVEDNGLWDTMKEGASNAIDAVKGKIDELGDKLEENEKRANDITDRQNALRFDEIDSLTSVAELRRDIAQLRAQAADKENNDAKTRLSLLDEAIIKQNEILAIEESLAAERVVIQNLEMAQGENRIEDYQKLAQLEAEQINLETTNAEKRRRFESERQTAINELNAGKQEQLMTDEELFRMEAEIEAEVLQEKKDTEYEIEQEQSERLVELAEETEEAKTAILEAQEEKRKDLINQSFDAAKDIANQTGQFLLDSNQSRLDNELAALETKQQTELLLAGDDAKKKEQIEKEYAKKKEKIERDFAKKQKKIAIANAVINGALSITKAFSQLGPIAGAIAAVLVAATTAFQIARINSQQFEKGGRVPLAKRGAKFGTFSGASHSQGGIPLVNGLTGQTVAEVEGRENFYVVNKDASAYINSLSDINQRIGGGVPLSNKSTRMADGGQADVSGQSLSINDITNEVVRRLPPVVVRVEDIKTGVQDYDDVTNVGIV